MTKRLSVPRVYIIALVRPGAAGLIAILTLDTLARSTVSALVPLQAYELLGSAQQVSVLYFLTAVTGLITNLAVPWLVIRLRRCWILRLGAACLIVSAGLFALYDLIAFVPAMVLQMFGASSVIICTNLYVMEHIPRRAFGRFEPIRTLFMGAGRMIGPALGVFLYSKGNTWLPYAVSAGFAGMVILYFTWLRVPRTACSLANTVPQTNPVNFVRRYFVQPRLALAWLLALGRAS